MNFHRASEITYFLLRVVAGLLFVHFGCLILFGWFGGMPGTPPGFTPPLMSQTGIGGLLELVGGLAITVGIFTRATAFILSGMMAVAYWQFHALPMGMWPAQNNGTAAILFCFLYLYMAAKGAGAWSVDAVICQKCGKNMSTATANH
jgi:putative oxidoreductase